MSSLLDDVEPLIYQRSILQHVSRTFALTIPKLPEEIVNIIGNGYLICRLTDTIEDSTGLTSEEKKSFFKRFLNIIISDADHNSFLKDLIPKLNNVTKYELNLMINLGKILEVMRSFDKDTKAALLNCVSKMAEGMSYFQSVVSLKGLDSVDLYNSYCYHVAGVVGEFFTNICCLFFPEIAVNRVELLKLSISFGQGLQMTNILKDVFNDKSRGVCWLPKDVFGGLEFDSMNISHENKTFDEGIKYLVCLAHGHLNDALSYCCMIPVKERGIRHFCAWTTLMAICNLKKIYHQPNFYHGDGNKISYLLVKIIGKLTPTFLLSNSSIKFIFRALSKDLPQINPDPFNSDIVIKNFLYH